MQEHVGQKLIDMKVAGHKEVQAAERCQVNTAALKDPCRYKRQDVDDKQVPGRRGYVIHNVCFLQ